MLSLMRSLFGSHSSHARRNIQQRGSKRSVTTRRLRPAEQLEDRRLMALIATELTGYDTPEENLLDHMEIESFSWGMTSSDALNPSTTGKATTPGPDDMPPEIGSSTAPSFERQLSTVQLSTVQVAVDPSNPNYNPFITIDYGHGSALENYDFPGTYAQRFDGVDKPFLRFKFDTVFTTKIDWSGPGDEGPEESISFVYGKIGAAIGGDDGEILGNDADLAVDAFIWFAGPNVTDPLAAVDAFIWFRGAEHTGALAAVDAYVWFVPNGDHGSNQGWGPWEVSLGDHLNSGQISPQFDWLVHLDRQFTNPVELLEVSDFAAGSLTQRFSIVDAGSALQHQVPWFDEAVDPSDPSAPTREDRYFCKEVDAALLAFLAE